MMLKPNYTEFQDEIDQRGIEYLVHFTPAINLMNIFEEKRLLSRARLEEFNIDQTDIFDYVEFTDEIRFDDKNYINLSVQHPNLFLFNRFRQKRADQSHIFWCVLKIDKKYIYQAETLFSVTNAANGHNKRTFGISGDIAKFRLMFSDSIPITTFHRSRTIKRNGLPLKYPTDEQAEVLVKDEISLADIMQVCFKNEEDLAGVKAALHDYDTNNFAVDETMFTNSR